MSGAMRIYGLDFTSAPSAAYPATKRAKKLLLAVCTLEGNRLRVDGFECLNGTSRGDFSCFEAWLGREGKWVAGLDFPFGQPARLIADLGWPGTWSGYVGHIAALGKKEFEGTLYQYKANRPVGRKELRRETDCHACAVSPMKLYGVPVGKMFFQGATRLLRSSLSIHPVRIIPNEQRHVIEAYPKLVACRCLGQPFNRPPPYKSDSSRKTSEDLRDARTEIVDALGAGGNRFENTYGFRVEMSPTDRNECIQDPGGDFLDSVLCAVQAAWGFSRKDPNFGIPENADKREGWICDPATCEGRR